jgi:hypothetical protein
MSDECNSRDEKRERLRRQRERKDWERQELTSFGFDDFLQLVGGDMDRTPTSTGIRIPETPSDGVNVGRYLALCACADVTDGDIIVGWAQLLTIAALIGQGDGGFTAPFYRDERDVKTPGWRFQDGFATFYLTAEPRAQVSMSQGPISPLFVAPPPGKSFDQESFVFEDATTSTMLYETCRIPAVPTAPGYLGLDQYQPPAIRGTRLLAFTRDVRVPFSTGSFEFLKIPIHQTMRVRAYCAVWQTNPGTRLKNTLAASSFAGGLAPEEEFLQVYPNISRYHRCGVRLLIDRRV